MVGSHTKRYLPHRDRVQTRMIAIPIQKHQCRPVANKYQCLTIEASRTRPTCWIPEPCLILQRPASQGSDLCQQSISSQATWRGWRVHKGERSGIANSSQATMAVIWYGLIATEYVYCVTDTCTSRHLHAQSCGGTRTLHRVAKPLFSWCIVSCG